MNPAMRWAVAAAVVGAGLVAARPGEGATWRERGCQYRKEIRLNAESLKDPLKAVIGQGLALSFTIPLKDRGEGDIDASLLKVYLDGHVRPDGADIRVTTSRGQPVPCKVVYCDPARYVLMVHKVPSRKARYFLYYGNPNAKPPEDDWDPKRGLFLTTKQNPGGMPKALADMKALQGRAATVYGTQYNLWVFNHYNPMGPVDYYLYHYKGWLRCPESGEYEFGTTSDGPSFFALGGKVVASQTRGRATREIKNATKVRLKKGVYPIEYWGGGPRGPYRVAAAWKRPSEKTVGVIRYEYFPKVYTSEVVATEKRGARIACDFDQKMGDSMPLDTGQINSYKFFNKTSHRAGARVPMKYLWEFGDGSTSTDKDPVHIFFEVGEYTIRLTASDSSGAKDVIQRTVMIEDYNTVDHERQHAIGALIKGAIHLEHHHSRLYLQIPPEEVEKMGKAFMPVVGTYGPQKVTPPVLWGMIRLYQRMRAHDKVIACSEAFLERFSRTSPKRAATCRLFLAEVYFKERNNPDKAYGLYERVVQSIGATPLQQKVARIRLADILLGLNKRDEAVRQLQLAEKIKDPGVNYKAPEFRINAYDVQVQDAIHRKTADTGFGVLARWERNFPMELVRGRLLVQRGKLQMVLKRYGHAVADFQKAVVANPHSPDLPEAFFRMGQGYLLLKKNREAGDAFRKVVTEFPRSRYYSYAKAGLSKAGG